MRSKIWTLFNKKKNIDKKSINQIESKISQKMYDDSLTKNVTSTHHSIYDQPNFMSIFTNISSKQTILVNKYLDMAFVAANISDSIVLARPLKTWNSAQNVEEINKKYEEDTIFTQSHFKKNISLSHKLDARINSRETLFKNIREIYPDFGTDIEEKISKEDFEIYKKGKNSFKHLFTVHPEYNSNISQKEALLLKEDKFSEIIDTPLFSKACEIQDYFLMSEIEIFLNKLENATPEQKKKLNKESILLPSGKKTSTIKLAKDVNQKISDRMQKYSEITELYKKLQLSPYATLDFENSENASNTLREQE